MKTSLYKEWPRADAMKGTSESAVNQSQRDLELNNGKAPVTTHSVSNQSTQRSSRDPRLAASLRSRPIQKETSMIQPAVSPSRRVTILKIADVDPRDGLPLFLSHSVELPGQDPATQPVPDMINLPPGIPISTFRVTTDPSDGQSVILSRTVEVTGHAPNSVVDASNSTTGQPSGSVVKARETHDDNQTMVRMMFKTALKEFVTKQIEETRDQGQSKKELRDLIVQKTVDKIMRSVKNIRSTEEMIGKYLSSYKGKIKKLIQEYFIYEKKALQ
ncbi:hypothetical protein BDA96_08G117100 [Sorghum bicolor]|uniref:Uncharacterized protein n=1 Tax=Sorghum bicolor TaxID=4558 RepID=A0A921U7A9_SORBI|nr:hypothetical protein BDA96_08G117100 [Sorghum bicolor]